MSKIAFVFPGQGSQYTGMGKEFYDTYPEAREVFRLAEEASGLNMEKLVFEENEQLHITEYTQTAMLAAEIAIWKVLDSKGIKPDVCLGLSLGEYAALAVSGVMDLNDLFKMIRKRGIYMQQAYPSGGAMSAVLGVAPKIAEEVCAQTEGIVSVANYNCPGQIVITGEKEAVDRASVILTKKGAKRCIPLKVSGPFHCELLKGAGEKLYEELKNVTVYAPKIPYLTNVTADYVTKEDDIKELLKRQVSSPVRFWQSIEKVIADGVTVFVEIGPGKTINGFIRKINRDCKVLNVDKLADLDRVAEEILC